MHSIIQSAVRQAIREEANAAFALAASTCVHDFQIVIKTAVREAVKDELEHMLSSATAASAAAASLAEQRLGERLAAAVDAAANSLRVTIADALGAAVARS